MHKESRITGTTPTISPGSQDEIVSRSPLISEGRNLFRRPSQSSLKVMNTDSEGTGVVFAEDPAVLFDELDQIAIGVTDEDRSDAEIERLVGRTYLSVLALLHVRLEGNVTMLEQSSDDLLQPVDTQCDMPCRVVSVVAGTGTLHKMDRASLVVSQPVGFLRVRSKPEYANVESLRALEIRDAHADMLNAGEPHLPFSPENAASWAARKAGFSSGNPRPAISPMTSIARPCVITGLTRSGMTSALK